MGRRLLVVETDDMELRAAIATARGRRVTLDSLIRIDTRNPAESLEELVLALRTAGQRLPRRAILLSEDVVSSVVELPVASPTDCSSSELQEMIRWELEPYTAASDPAEVSDGGALCCGYTPAESQTASPGLHLWRACAVPDAQLQAWMQEFERCRLRLQSLYPLSGSAADTGGDDTDDSVVLGRMRRAAGHALGRDPTDATVCVSARMSARSRWRGKPLRQLIVAASVLLVAGLETSLEIRTRAAQAESERANTARAEVKRRLEQETRQREWAAEIEDAIDDAQLELSELESSRRDLQRVLSAHIGSLNHLLDVLAQRTSDDVVLRRVSADLDGHAEIQFWSLAEESGQRFVDRFSLDTQPVPSPFVRLKATDELFELRGFLFDVALDRIHQRSLSDSADESLSQTENFEWVTTLKNQADDS